MMAFAMLGAFMAGLVIGSVAVNRPLVTIVVPYRRAEVIKLRAEVEHLSASRAKLWEQLDHEQRVNSRLRAESGLRGR